MEERRFTFLTTDAIITIEHGEIIKARPASKEDGRIRHWRNYPNTLVEMEETEIVSIITPMLDWVEPTGEGNAEPLVLITGTNEEMAKQLMELKRDELIALCDSKKVVYISTDTKAQLIEKYLG